MTMPDQPKLPSLASNDSDPYLRLTSGGTQVYLIRHADALPDANEITEGGYDEQPLSNLGRQQAIALAQRMSQAPLAAIYSSPIRRAQQTASFIGEALGLEVYIDMGLREVDLGPMPPHLLVDMTPEEQATALHTYLREIQDKALLIGVWSQIPGCEPSAALRTRLTETVDLIARQHVGKRVAVISHNGAINAYIAAFLGLERDFFFPAFNTSITTVRVKGQQHLLMGLNDIAHLRQENVHIR